MSVTGEDSTSHSPCEATLAAGELAMVGDRLYTDIATGVQFGMTSILVLTGEATLADVQTSPIKPI